jgi:hypothetical protein
MALDNQKQTEVPVELPAAAKELVARMVAEQVAEQLKAISANMASQDKGDAGDRRFADMLAMAIAQLTDQGVGRKRVAPEVLVFREESHRRMLLLLQEARAKGEEVLYSLCNRVYIDEQLVEPRFIGADKREQATKIVWDGVPNLALVPENETAREIFSAFKDSIGNSAKIAGITGVDEQDLHVTPGGLVVVGATPPSRRPGGGDKASGGLRVIGSDVGSKVSHVHILGTVAQPAAQRI